MIDLFTEKLKQLKQEILRFKTTFRRVNQVVATDTKTVNVTFTMEGGGWIRSSKNAVLTVKGTPADALCQMQFGVTTFNERVVIQNRVLDDSPDTISKFIFWIEYGNAQDAQDISAGRTVTVTYPITVSATSKIDSVQVQYIDPFSMI